MHEPSAPTPDDGSAGPSGQSGLAALLLLADGRFPAGGYAHSGGVEPCIDAGLIGDLADLEAFLLGRAHTVGVVTASFAAAACHTVAGPGSTDFSRLDGELDVRMPSAAQRATSRQLGRQLLRVMSTIAPHPAYRQFGTEPHQPLVLGAACAVMRLGPLAAAVTSLHECVVGPSVAAVRILGLDPLDTHAILARLGPTLDCLALEAVERSTGAPEDLPAAAAPLLDILAERHAVRAGRLFAS
jgi:urease accessory protein